MNIQWLSSTLVTMMAVALLSGCASMQGSNQPTTDEQLIKDAMYRLRTDSVTAEYPFGVEVVNGIAKVYGNIPDESLRIRVLGVVRGTPGITQVIDKLYRR